MENCIAYAHFAAFDYLKHVKFDRKFGNFDSFGSYSETICLTYENSLKKGRVETYITEKKTNYFIK